MQCGTTNEKIDAACEVLKGTFVTNSSEREKFCRINILKLDGKDYLERILSYAEKLMHTVIILIIVEISPLR